MTEDDKDKRNTAVRVQALEIAKQIAMHTQVGATTISVEDVIKNAGKIEAYYNGNSGTEQVSSAQAKGA
jgi:hypothetical protein